MDEKILVMLGLRVIMAFSMVNPEILVILRYGTFIGINAEKSPAKLLGHRELIQKYPWS